MKYGVPPTLIVKHETLVTPEPPASTHASLEENACSELARTREEELQEAWESVMKDKVDISRVFALDVYIHNNLEELRKREQSQDEDML